MKVAVVGCGAMGSLYAAMFARAGNHVLAIDGWPDHVEAINRAGLRIENAKGSQTVKIQASLQAPEEAFDLVIIAAKARDVLAATRSARSLLDETTVVVTIQNGLGSSAIVAEELGRERVIVGIASAFGARLVGPGRAAYNAMEKIRLGAYANIPAERVAQTVDHWRQAGFNCDAAGSIVRMQWEKLICNVAYSAPCALTGLTVGAVRDDPTLGEISRAAAYEAWTIANALGVGVEITDPIAFVRAFADPIPDAKPSLLVDIENRRPTEIDFINGAVPREAAKINLAAPVNATLSDLVRFKERSFSA